jgi:hypothetical protein
MSLLQHALSADERAAHFDKRLGNFRGPDNLVFPLSLGWIVDAGKLLAMQLLPDTPDLA